MSNKKKNEALLKGVGIYGIGTFGTKILSFIIVPLYTYYISTSDMGVYDILMSTINLLTPIITLQISDAAYRWIIREDIDNKEIYIISTLQVLLFNCLVALALICLFNHFIQSIPYCLYFCSVLLLSRAFQTTQKLLRALRRQWTFVVSGIVFTFIFLLLNVLQLCVFHKGVESLFQSALVAYTVSVIIAFILEPRLRVNIFQSPNLKTIKEMYKYSAPLVPNYLNWWIINSSDRYIVLFILGSSANGILAIAHKFPTVLQSVFSLFNHSWQDLSVADSDSNISKYYTDVFRRYYRFVLTAVAVIIPMTKIVISLVMSDAYKTACNYVAFYYLGTVFQSFSAFYGTGYLRNKKTKNAFTTSIYGAIVNAAVNLLFIRFIGLQAAAVSTFFGFLVMFIIREKQNKNELGIKINLGEFIPLVVLVIAISIISIVSGLIVNAIISVICFLIFFLLHKATVLHFCRKLKRKNDR